MKLLKPIEESGFFWLPEDPKRKIPGVLRISESGEATLEVTSLSRPEEFALGEHHFGDPRLGEQFRKLKRVLGIIKNNYVTLEDCFYFASNYALSSGLTTSTIRPSFVFNGVSYDNQDDITFS